MTTTRKLINLAIQYFCILSNNITTSVAITALWLLKVMASLVYVADCCAINGNYNNGPQLQVACHTDKSAARNGKCTRNDATSATSLAEYHCYP